MFPTLQVGDYLFVSRSSYGIGNNTLPFNLLNLEKRIMFKAPVRGDIVVFRAPPQNGRQEDFIKRLIGLPGDKLQLVDGLLFINGSPVSRIYKGIAFRDDIGGEAEIWEETLPNGEKYLTYAIPDILDADNFEITVPAAKYFFMGDNRDMSKDSRFQEVGLIDETRLIGKAKVIAFSTKKPFWQVWEWADSFRLNRFIVGL
jgi:signal peptidase I